MFRVGMVALAAIFLIAPVASAVEEGQKDNGYSLTDERYLNVYKEGHQAGLDVGRNLLDWTWDSSKPRVSDERIKASTERIQLWLNPPELPAPPEHGGEYVEPTATSTGGTGWSSVVECESGGDYSIDTGNGYYGAYQFDSGTWDAYGDPQYSEADEAPPSVQDAAAASVPYDAWPNC
jgi:hypothetical protein